MPTPWRRGLYKEIAKLELNGSIIDLGGSAKSGYQELIKGSHNITIANLDDNKSGGNMNQATLECDLEKPFPMASASFDAALAMNVLEHIFNHAQFLQESYRILKPSGALYIGVPFLMHVHPSPHDYWRYTAETLQRLLDEAGFKEISILPIANGPVTASVQLLSGIVRIAFIRVTYEYIGKFKDWLLSKISRSDLKTMYPMGYFVTARKV
jgi:SAM-dependent methyltransferase